MHRERGEAEAAAVLTNEALAQALAVVREDGESEEAVDDRLASIFHAESERVANASLIAELVAQRLEPLIAAQVSASGALPAPVVAASPRVPDRPSAPARAPIISSSSVPRTAPLGIADFIDEMLAQDRSSGPATPLPRAS